MNIGIKKPQKEEKAVANFRHIAQSFWKAPDSKSESKSTNAASNRVEYVGGNFEGTFTNKELEEIRAKTSIETVKPDSKPKIHYERHFK